VFPFAGANDRQQRKRIEWRVANRSVMGKQSSRADPGGEGEGREGEMGFSHWRLLQ
jgi:hypothetical protein